MRGGAKMEAEPMSVENILQTKLRLLQPVAQTGWQIWEHKTFNIHRGVLRWQPLGESLTFSQMSQSIFEQVKASFRVSRWRGFAFGALIEARAFPKDIAQIDSTIDTRQNSKGTWQWTVLACENAQTAVGVHTWTAGYLAPVFRELMGHYESMGFEVGTFKKEKDALMRFLVAAAKLKGFEFTEFER